MSKYIPKCPWVIIVEDQVGQEDVRLHQINPVVTNTVQTVS